MTEPIAHCAAPGAVSPLVCASVSPVCVADCDATWRPFLAADDDEPSGYWSIYDRADGKKQWAYFGYALYIYVDESAGKTYGHMTYDDIDDFELLPDNRSRDLLRLRWRVAPP